MTNNNVVHANAVTDLDPPELVSARKSLEKIMSGEICTNDMLARTLLIDGSPYMPGLLEDAGLKGPEVSEQLSISSEVYLHIARTGLKEHAQGSSVGLMNAKEAYAKATGVESTKTQSMSLEELREKLGEFPQQLLDL